jgi:protein-L-isoaspartate(D-aspartate) O-methyltransferase
MIDYDRQRLTMVETQLRPSQVTDRPLLAAMGALPRERFVPPTKRLFAYMDAGVEVWPSVDGAPARYLLAPVVLARLIQLAAVGPEDRVLDIGCATGYSTAVLACLARSVIGLEAEPELAAAASNTLRELATDRAFGDVQIITGALNEGYPAGGPYDVILLNGAVSELPGALLGQLKEGGRLAAIIAHPAPGRAVLFFKVGDNASGVPHFDAAAKPLPGFAPAPCFTF